MWKDYITWLNRFKGSKPYFCVNVAVTIVLPGSLVQISFLIFIYKFVFEYQDVNINTYTHTHIADQ